MICEYHPSKQIQVKCLECDKYMCSICEKEHRKAQKNSYHQIITLTEICETFKEKLKVQINRLSSKIHQLNNLGDYEMGQTIIDACLKQINEFINKYFQKIKEDYRKICDAFWNVENSVAIKELENKKNILKGWRQILKKDATRIIDFEIEEIYENNKIDEDEEQLIQESESFLLTAQAPKIYFNELALRRINQLMGKIIYISQNYEVKTKSKKKTMRKSSSAKSYKIISNPKPKASCKFIEGTNIMYQYAVNASENIQLDQKQSNELSLKRVQFREFVCPMRAVSISVNGELYLIGGQSLKDRRITRQIWCYQRQYNSMRIICLLKKGRVSHCVCSSTEQNEQVIYVFGGKGQRTLEKVDLKRKMCEQIAEYKNEIVGGSMIEIKNVLYVFGGLVRQGQLNKTIVMFDLAKNKYFQEKIPLNYQEFKMPVSPLLHLLPQSIQQNQILIIGGYFQHQKSSYSNNHILVYNINYNYISELGKPQIIYPILSNGNANCLSYSQKQNKIQGIVDMKRNNQMHGPNFGIIFQYGLKEGRQQIDFFRL